MNMLRSAKGKKVTFQVTAAPGSKVFIAGSFNDWDPAKDAMRANPDIGRYTTTLVLPPGRHEYKFVVDGAWRVDPSCPGWVANDQGSTNSVIHV